MNSSLLFFSLLYCSNTAFQAPSFQNMASSSIPYSLITLAYVDHNIHLACVDAHSHVDIFIGSSVKILDGINHGETHGHTALGMV